MPQSSAVPPVISAVFFGMVGGLQDELFGQGYGMDRISNRR